jgi:hypothetical protein
VIAAAMLRVFKLSQIALSQSKESVMLQQLLRRYRYKTFRLLPGTNNELDLTDLLNSEHGDITVALIGNPTVTGIKRGDTNFASATTTTWEFPAEVAGKARCINISGFLNKKLFISLATASGVSPISGAAVVFVKTRKGV